MTFTSDSAREAGKKGGKIAVERRKEKQRKLEAHLLWLAEGGAEKFHNKMEALSNGAELTKPEKEFMGHFKDLMEYHTPKLSRSELTGKDGKDLEAAPVLVKFIDGSDSNTDSR